MPPPICPDHEIATPCSECRLSGLVEVLERFSEAEVPEVDESALCALLMRAFQAGKKKGCRRGVLDGWEQAAVSLERLSGERFVQGHDYEAIEILGHAARVRGGIPSDRSTPMSFGDFWRGVIKSPGGS